MISTARNFLDFAPISKKIKVDGNSKLEMTLKVEKESYGALMEIRKNGEMRKWNTKC